MSLQECFKTKLQQQTINLKCLFRRVSVQRCHHIVHKNQFRRKALTFYEVAPSTLGHQNTLVECQAKPIAQNVS